MTKVYICGKMTGLPMFNYPKFNQKAKELRLAGFEVYNPAEINGDESWTWEMYMRKALKMLINCDIVYVLNGYETSRGAKVEIELAKNLNIRIITESGKILHKGNGLQCKEVLTANM